jgi:hypothetical protein
MRILFLSYGLLASFVYGHVQMKTPYPIRSPLNPQGGSNKDYSYTSPLLSSGANYPCKGYQNDTFVSVATYAPGGTYEMELDGGATHGGGSCQISLSYDTAETFTVIKSIEGGCPIPEKYSFTIPSDAPIGHALLAWTWFNKNGNREMYMNCAQVTIQGGSSKRSHPRELVHRLQGRDFFKSRPSIFIANINGPGQCTTTSGDEVNFPLPGPDVEGSVSGTGYTCRGSAIFLAGDPPSDWHSSDSQGHGSYGAPAATHLATSLATPRTPPLAASLVTPGTPPLAASLVAPGTPPLATSLATPKTPPLATSLVTPGTPPLATPLAPPTPLALPCDTTSGLAPGGGLPSYSRAFLKAEMSSVSMASSPAPLVVSSGSAAVKSDGVAADRAIPPSPSATSSPVSSGPGRLLP